jgi:hypothetical protein
VLNSSSAAFLLVCPQALGMEFYGLIFRSQKNEIIKVLLNPYPLMAN